MSTSKKRPESSSDKTRPDMGEGAMMAAVDHHEATARGVANPPSKDAPKDAKDEPKSVAPPKPKVALRVFSRVSGLKPDQFAGFGSYAKRLKMGPMSIPDWHEALKKFMTRSV